MDITARVASSTYNARCMLDQALGQFRELKQKNLVHAAQGHPPITNHIQYEFIDNIVKDLRFQLATAAQMAIIVATGDSRGSSGPAAHFKEKVDTLTDIRGFGDYQEEE
jgi:hypothetical protein